VADLGAHILIFEEQNLSLFDDVNIDWTITWFENEVASSHQKLQFEEIIS
jgi:hypothetical protein